MTDIFCLYEKDSLTHDDTFFRFDNSGFRQIKKKPRSRKLQNVTFMYFNLNIFLKLFSLIFCEHVLHYGQDRSLNNISRKFQKNPLIINSHMKWYVLYGVEIYGYPIYPRLGLIKFLFLTASKVKIEKWKFFHFLLPLHTGLWKSMLNNFS